MQNKIHNNLIHSYLIIIFLFLTISFTSGTLFLLLSNLIYAYIIFYFSSKKIEPIIIVIYFTIIALLLIPVIIGTSGVRFGNWLALCISLLSYILFANYLSKKENILLSIKLSKLLFVSYTIFLSFLLMYSLIYNHEYGDFINHIFIDKSRNVVIYFYFTLCLYYLFNYLLSNLKINFLLIFAFSFFCLISGSRTAFILSLIILLACIMKNKKVILPILLLSLLSFFFFNTIESFVLNKTNFSQGLDTPRTMMYYEYYNNIDFFSFISGMGFSNLPTVLSFNSNPHNSFIYINLLYGANVVIYLLLLFISLFNYFRIDFRLALLFLTLIIRLSLDTVSYNLFFSDIFIIYLLIKSFRLKK